MNALMIPKRSYTFPGDQFRKIMNYHALCSKRHSGGFALHSRSNTAPRFGWFPPGLYESLDQNIESGIIVPILHKTARWAYMYPHRQFLWDVLSTPKTILRRVMGSYFDELRTSFFRFVCYQRKERPNARIQQRPVQAGFLFDISTRLLGSSAS